MGLHVTVISTSPKKEKEAREHLGADNFLISKDDKQMAVRRDVSQASNVSCQACQCNAKRWLGYQAPGALWEWLGPRPCLCTASVSPACFAKLRLRSLCDGLVFPCLNSNVVSPKVVVLVFYFNVCNVQRAASGGGTVARWHH